jgi:hypothetical protein
MQLSARNPIEVNMAEPYVFPLVMPERSHAANETTFSADNQPKKRGRPRGSRNKMSPAMKAMIVEVIEELGRVDLEDWDKLPCGDGPKGHLKFLAVRDLKFFLRLVARLAGPTVSRSSTRSTGAARSPRLCCMPSMSWS